MTSSCTPMPRLRFALLASAAALATGAACGVRPATRASPRMPAPAATAGTLNTRGPWPYGASYATQGLTIATHVFEPFVVPVTVVVLFALFFIQSRGTGTVGAMFGPVTVEPA